MMKYRLICADVMDGLAMLPDKSVQTCATSPPYWGLRDYGIEPSVWGGDPEHAHVFGAKVKIHKGGPRPGATSAFANGNRAVIGAQVAMNERFVEGLCECGAWRGCLGLEPTPELFVRNIVLVFREVWRVLRDDGTLWINLGDSYAGSGKGGNPEAGKQATNAGSQTVGVLYGTGTTAREAAVTNVSRLTFPESGIKAKDLIGIPWMCAFALRSDGWYLRSEIIWHKPNPMPESVTDRPTKGHEQIFLLTKQPRYFYDADAIAEPTAGRELFGNSRKLVHDDRNDCDRQDMSENWSRNKRSVWTVPSAPFREAHFATFAPDLIEPCILAGSRIGDKVLDPFSGSGTVGEVALSHQRDYEGIERKPEYVEMSRRRLEKVAPLLAREESQLDERVGV